MYKFVNSTPGIVFDLPFYGKVYIPGQFLEAFGENVTCRFLHSNDLENLDDLVDFLSRGGISILKGDWKSIVKLPERLGKFRDELIASFIDEARQKGTIRNPRTRRWLERRYQQTLSHLMLLAHDDSFTDIKLPPRIPYLLELLGDKAGAENDLPILAPLPVLLKILSALEHGHYISDLDMEIFAPPNVLTPFSQDTVDLFAEALWTAGDYIKKSGLEILDMGCGSGVLTLLTADVLSDRNAHIISTDILPEAVAANKINAQRFTHKSNTNVSIETTESGDLFEPVGKTEFDIIIFNAPWVISPPKSRAEMAAYDAKQETVIEFLTQVKNYLKTQGYILLGYSDHSGKKALKRLEENIQKADLKIDKCLKKRVQTRQKNRKRENIIVYILN